MCYVYGYGQVYIPSSPTKWRRVMGGEIDLSRKKTAKYMLSWKLI